MQKEKMWNRSRYWLNRLKTREAQEACHAPKVRDCAFGAGALSQAHPHASGALFPDIFFFGNLGDVIANYTQYWDSTINII